MTPRHIKLAAAITLSALTLLLHLRSRHTADVAWVQRSTANSFALGHAEGSLFLMFFTPYQLLTPPETQAQFYGGHLHSFDINRSARVPIVARQASGSPRFSRLALHRVDSIAPWANPFDDGANAPILASARTFYLPLWLLEAILSLFILRWLIQETQYHRSRRAAGHAICYHCGYDLRASPTRCPECGHPTPTPPPPS